MALDEHICKCDKLVTGAMDYGKGSLTTSCSLEFHRQCFGDRVPEGVQDVRLAILWAEERERQENMRDNLFCSTLSLASCSNKHIRKWAELHSKADDACNGFIQLCILTFPYCTSSKPYIHYKPYCMLLMLRLKNAP